jgi:transketolase
VLVPTPATDIDLATAAELGQQLRVDSIRSSTSAGSGHPTSSMSAADLMAVLVSRHLRYDWDNPDHPGNDHLIFSKGHASPLLYSIYKAVGVVSDEELMTGYRRFGSRLEGHPTPVLPWVDVATGSLGQGLPDGVGVALAGKYLDELPYRVWVLCGDSEMAEGSIWEAFDKASHYKLANLIAIVDVNRLGQRGPTDLGWDLEAYRRRAEAFGARVFEIDGHDVAAIDRALAEAGDISGERPSVILARTIKGRGASEVEDREDWHGKPLPPEMAERAITELGGERHLLVRGPAPADGQPRLRADRAIEVKLPVYDRGQKVATRKAYGEALAALDLRQPVRPGASRPVLRDVHRRAAAGRRGGGRRSARLPAVRLDLRRVLHPGLRFHPDGRHLTGQHLPGRLARRSGDRCRRPIPDGPGRPGHDARGARLRRALPQRRHQRGRPGRGHG